MPRPRFQITLPDLPAARDYLSRKLVLDIFLDHLDDQSTAVSNFAHARDDPELLNEWCDRNLTADQWRQLHSAIRAARFRQQDDNSKHVALTQEAWRILSKLAERDRVTLSTVIETHLSSLLRASANNDQVDTDTKPSAKPKRQRQDAASLDLTRPRRLQSPSDQKKITRWSQRAEKLITDGYDVDGVLNFMNAHTRGVKWTAYAIFLHVGKAHWRTLCLTEIRKHRAAGVGYKAIAEDFNVRQIGTLETEPGKQIWTWPRVKQLFESEEK